MFKAFSLFGREIVTVAMEPAFLRVMFVRIFGVVIFKACFESI